MLRLEFEAAAPEEETIGVKERIAMTLEQLGYRDIRCTEAKVIRPEQMRIDG